ncbi:hypothetical protein QTN47_21505 [Danxiaibacter flavus]|uniref:Cupin domain-containing protein n=1 Tax=Danxiaibacter flavus TaxID=3049108 RepID=A0ABV3ZKR5_9BACT|nr:hypothetical protein QNM32_21510 [Chitinophagaceae bacterium DXS]
MQITGSSKDWAWPDDLDALIAAPQYHKLLFENDFVRVLDTCIRPGETTPIHTHRYPASLYVLSWSDFLRFDDMGNVIFDSRTLTQTPESGSARWTESFAPHALQNIGVQDLHIISVEQKNL